MKTLEEIKKEYEGYELESIFVTDLDGFLIFIGNGIKESERAMRAIQKCIKIDSRLQKLAKLRNHFPFLFRMEEVDIYEEDIQILEKELDFVLGYKEKFERLFPLATDKNFSEFTRLVDFSCLYYNQHVDYFQAERDRLNYSYRGYTYHNDNCQNDIAVFDVFFNQKISEYSDEKAVEKRK